MLDWRVAGPNPFVEILYSVLGCAIFFAGGIALQNYAENSILFVFVYGFYFLAGLMLLDLKLDLGLFFSKTKVVMPVWCLQTIQALDG